MLSSLANGMSTKSKKVTTTAGVAMSDELKEYAVRRAEEDGRSLSAWVRRLIENHRSNGNARPGQGHAEHIRQPA